MAALRTVAVVLVSVPLLSLLCLSPVSADACDGDDYGKAGDFSFYLLVQEWSAEFCYSHSSYAGCQSPTAFMKVNLTLHGLWPQYSSEEDGNDYPQCCPSTYGATLSRSTVNSVLPALELYWPSEEDPTGNDLSESLWQHEWAVHGTCTGMTQLSFLNTALNLTQSMHTPSVISSHVGSSVSRSAIEAVYNKGAACGSGSCLVFLECDDSDYLLSVITCWSTAFKQIECPTIVTGGSDRCGSGNVKITAFS